MLFVSSESCTGAWIQTGIWIREIPAAVLSLHLSLAPYVVDDNYLDRRIAADDPLPTACRCLAMPVTTSTGTFGGRHGEEPERSGPARIDRCGPRPISDQFAGPEAECEREIYSSGETLRTLEGVTCSGPDGFRIRPGPARAKPLGRPSATRDRKSPAGLRTETLESWTIPPRGSLCSKIRASAPRTPAVPRNRGCTRCERRAGPHEVL